jgi:hypothetical protein
MPTRQPLHQPCRLLGCDGGQRRGGLWRELGARNEPEQAEQPLGVLRQGLIRMVERGPHRGVRVAVHRQGVQRALCLKLRDVVSNGLVRMLRQVRRGDPQRQGQQRTRLGQPRGPLGLGLDPVGPPGP